MPNLTHLRLHQAPLPEFLQDMPGLRGLQVRTTPPFPDWLGDLRGLEELSLRSDRSWQDNAPDWSVLRRLSGMRKLSLKLFYLREVDYSFLEDLQELRELELYSSGEATLPDGLSPHLEVLALEGSQGFRDLPSDLARFDQLRVLKAELDGEARGLPEDLSKLHRLEVVELKLPRGSSGEVPDLSGLPGLRSLKIKGLAHSTFPASACGLKHLEEVLLTSGRYASLDPNIGNLGALRTLELPNGALSSVPDSVCELTRLEKLDLSYNPLERLPEGIDRLTRLHELNLRNTALKTLPAGVGRLARLQYLTLWECKQLEALCPSVAGMKSLKRIIALDCALRSLPEDLGLLPSIEWLWLGNNQLRAVPDSLYEISDATFRELRLTGNEFHADQIPRLKALEKRIVRLEVKMPRTAKTIAIPEEAPTDPLSDKVVAQLERLGATPSDPSPRTHERFPFGQWPVPDAIRQFRGWKWEWKTLESDRDDAWMVQLGISGGLDEHEIIHHQPVICFGHMDGGNYSFLMRLDDPDPTDPKVYRIDHDAFGDQSAPVFSPSLSRFLGSLKA